MINKKYLKIFIIVFLSLFTTSCIGSVPLDDEFIVGESDSLDQLDEALKEKKEFLIEKYDIENKDMVGNFLISNYQHPNIEDFSVSAMSFFTYNYEEPIELCSFADDKKFSNYYDLGYLESKFKIYFRDIGLEEEYFYLWVTQRCKNFNSSVFIDEKLIERKLSLSVESLGDREVFNLYSNDLDIERLKLKKLLRNLKFTIEEYYTHYDERSLIRSTSIVIEYAYPDKVHNVMASFYQVEDLLYLVSNEYTQNERFVEFDLQFRAFLEEYIYTYEKFEVRA